MITYEGNKYRWEYNSGHIRVYKNDYFLVEFWNEGGYAKINSITGYVAIPNEVFKRMGGLTDGQDKENSEDKHGA